MEFNSIIFPCPKPSYSAQSLFGNIIYIPKSKQFSISEIQAFRSNLSLSKQVIANQVNSPKRKHFKFNMETLQEANTYEYLPCLFLPYNGGSTKVLLYFHGNAEDIGGTVTLLETLKSKLKVHIIAMEYPGYGIYKGKPDADTILKDTEYLFNFLTKMLGLKTSDIIVFGRSIGSGPATFLAGKYKIFALALMSPYTSIRAVARHLVGRVGGLLVADRFRNVDYIKRVKSPILIVHGMKDRLIPYVQSQELCEKCQEAMMVLPENMDHNIFDTEQDLILPFKRFLKKNDYEPEPKVLHLGRLSIPPSLFIKPMEASNKSWFSRLFN